MINSAELKKQMLFSDLTDAELDVIAKKVSLEQYPKGAPVFKEGEPTRGLYLVKNGRVEISKMTADGWKQTLAVLTENQIFGELAVIEDKKAHGADATAIDAAGIVRITIEDFKAFEKSDAAMMYKVMKVIARVASRKVNSMNEKLMKLLISY